MFIQQVKQSLLDFLYPRICPVCSKIIQPKGEKACPECRKKLTYITEPRCSKCGKQLCLAEQEFCYNCTKRSHHYKKGIALFEYDSHMQRSIINFKYHHQKEFADFYVEEIITYLGKAIQRISPNALVPIPIHSRKRNQRGYNQAELLADGIGKALSIPVFSGLLVRKKYTIPQKELDDKERLKNLERAFFWSNSWFQENLKIIPDRLILVDDIFTTGSTVEACTKVLLEQGVKEVYFLSLCIGRGDEGG